MASTTFDPHKNFAISNITGGTAISGTSTGTVTVTTSTGGRFPASGNYVLATAGSVPDPSTSEIVRGTFSGDTLTITARAQESTTARTFSAGDIIYAGPTVKSLTDIETAVNTLENAAVGGATYQTVPFTYYGNLIPTNSPFRIYNDSPTTKNIYSVKAWCNVAPVGQSLLVDITNSGSSIYSGSVYTIPSASNTGSANQPMNSLSAVSPNSYIQMAVKQVGTSTAGSDLSVQVTWY
jgi:hypothetical protein